MSERTPPAMPGMWSKAIDGLAPEQAEDIRSRCKARDYPEKSSVFRHGDASTSVFIVQEGRVRLFFTSERGDEFTVAIGAEGFVVGLLTVILGHKRFLSAECLTAAKLGVLPRRECLALMETYPRFGINIAQLVAEMAMDCLIDSSSFALENGTVRLGRTLLKLAVLEQAGPAGQSNSILRVSSTQDQLAKMVGVSRAWVNAILSNFESRGFIQRNRNMIVIVDDRAFASFLSTLGQ